MFRKALILLSVLAIFAIKPAHAYYLDFHGSDPDYMLEYQWDSLEVYWSQDHGYFDYLWGNRPSIAGAYFSVEADAGEATDALATVRVTSWVENIVEVNTTNFSDLSFGYEASNVPMSVTELITLNISEPEGYFGHPPVGYHNIWLNSNPTVIDETMAASATIHATSKAYAEFELVSVVPVPEPGIFCLFGTGLMGIAVIRMRLKGTSEK